MPGYEDGLDNEIRPVPIASAAAKIGPSAVSIFLFI